MYAIVNIIIMYNAIYLTILIWLMINKMLVINATISGKNYWIKMTIDGNLIEDV